MHYIILYITVRTRTYNYIDLFIVEFQNMKCKAILYVVANGKCMKFSTSHRIF
jgi:hypothetical protein